VRGRLACGGGWVEGAETVPSLEAIEMFLFFTSRLGCLGSLALSVVVTLILLAIFHVI
jgi:hypothetical protein